MEQKHNDWSRGRFIAALLLGFLLLAAVLPSTGMISTSPPSHPDMWRFGPFLFFPKSFFFSLSIIGLATGCTILGIIRRHDLEIVGWTLLGFLFLAMMMR